MLNLDTHILVDSFEGLLTKRERGILESDPEWSISAIVLWEIEMLFLRNRITRGLDDPTLAADLARVHIWPVTSEVCLQLRRLDFHSDPADELIAATSLVHQIPLVTRDQRIRRSKIVRCL